MASGVAAFLGALLVVLSSPAGAVDAPADYAEELGRHLGRAVALAPPAARAALHQIVGNHLADPRLAEPTVTVGASIWVEGLGQFTNDRADEALLPASNQKVFTGMAALAFLDWDQRLFTEVRASGTVDGGVLFGDLVIVGGGDPLLTRRGTHSLDVLAEAVRDAGVVHVEGSLVVDESRYDSERRAPGWFDWHVPRHVGQLSALVVDGNREGGDIVVVNGSAFRDALQRGGVTVAGPLVAGVAPLDSVVLAALGSHTIGELIDMILLRSDNMVAEMLLKEVGWATSGVGTTAGGITAGTAMLARGGLRLEGTSADGSGLSRLDRRSPREWCRLLTAALHQPWGEELRRKLPVAGHTGTLAGRFRGTAGVGNIRAKTGSILEARALSGYMTTASGRAVVFSVVVNGARPAESLGPVDALLAAVAAFDG